MANHIFNSQFILYSKPQILVGGDAQHGINFLNSPFQSDYTTFFVIVRSQYPISLYYSYYCLVVLQ